MAVGIGVTTVDHLDAARSTVAAVAAAVPGTPVLVGGQAVRSPEVAGLLGVREWAADGWEVVEAVERLAAAPDRRRQSAARDVEAPAPEGAGLERQSPVAVVDDSAVAAGARSSSTIRRTTADTSRT